MFQRYRLPIGLTALVFCGTLFAADTTNGIGQKVSFVPPANAGSVPLGQAGTKINTTEPLVFSAPPRESPEEAARLYQPVAKYFSRILGRPVEYRQPKSWLSYQSDSIKGGYDILFDEPHFNSWNISRLNHVALAKIADENVFAVVARKDNAQITAVKQLAGKKICTIGATNLGTLALLAEFEPMRQPLVIENTDWTNVHEGVVEGRCAAGILPVAILQKYDTGNTIRTIHRSRALPNLVFSAGPRLTTEEQTKLSNALTSADGKRVLASLLAANGAEKGLALVTREDYAGMDRFLKTVWGYAH